MGSYDLKRLAVAIQYISRMAEGRNPVTNRPAPENEVLTNINVNRCLKFVEEILSDVHSAGGTVGAVRRKPAASAPPLSQTFPYEILSGFRYEQDQQVSYFLNQIGSLLPEGEKMPVKATMLTDWLRENGYLEKRMMEDIGKENSVPTPKGEELGLYTEKAGMAPNQYYRVFYNEGAQRFIIENFRKILTEVESIREKKKKERRQASPASRRQTSLAISGKDAHRPGHFGENMPETKQADPSPSGAGPAPREGSRPQGSPIEDDPAFASLVSSLANAREEDYMGNPAYDFGKTFARDFMEDGWESAGDDLPW